MKRIDRLERKIMMKSGNLPKKLYMKDGVLWGSYLSGERPVNLKELEDEIAKAFTKEVQTKKENMILKIDPEPKDDGIKRFMIGNHRVTENMEIEALVIDGKKVANETI